MNTVNQSAKNVAKFKFNEEWNRDTRKLSMMLLKRGITTNSEIHRIVNSVVNHYKEDGKSFKLTSFAAELQKEIINNSMLTANIRRWPGMGTARYSVLADAFLAYGSHEQLIESIVSEDVMVKSIVNTNQGVIITHLDGRIERLITQTQ